MRGRTYLVAALGGAVLAAMAAPGLAGHLTLTKGPYVQDPSSTAITVLWETDQPGKGVVHFKAAGDAQERTVEGPLFDSVRTLKAARDDKAPLNPRYLYRARLTGLAPDTEYAYSVVVTFENGSVTSGDHKLRTWPEKETGPVTFIVYGDARSNPDKHRAVVQNFDRYNPAFILNVGDLTWDTAIYGLWNREFFNPLYDMIDHVPIFVARGSHEHDAKDLLRVFDMPGDRTTYSFDYGSVHVVVLDVPKSDDKGKTEIAKWLAQDLAATKAPWRILMYHAPTFNLGGHKSYAVRTTYLPVMEQGGVDVVFAGHSHQYERFFPLRRAGSPDAQPVTFITQGGGGAPFHRSVPQPLHACAAQGLSFTVITVDKQTFALKTLNEKNEVVDSLTLTKQGGRYDDAYLAKVRPTEEAILAQGLARMDIPLVSDLPTPKKPAELKLKAAFPGLGAPVTLSVRLAAASEAKYEMAPATVSADAKAEEIKLSATARPHAKAGTHQSEVWERPGEKDVLSKKTFLDPDLLVIVTATCGGVTQEREFVGVFYNKSGRPVIKKEAEGPGEEEDEEPPPLDDKSLGDTTNKYQKNGAAVAPAGKDKP